MVNAGSSDIAVNMLARDCSFRLEVCDAVLEVIIPFTVLPGDGSTDVFDKSVPNEVDPITLSVSSVDVDASSNCFFGLSNRFFGRTGDFNPGSK